jgi:uncharacterized BrkB/YihY/UPF0761 family membrane protein
MFALLPPRGCRLEQTVSRLSEHKDARLGAALAYYSVFSLGPLILIAIAMPSSCSVPRRCEAKCSAPRKGCSVIAAIQAMTAALFEVGKFLIGLYIGKQGLESTYGAAASIIVVLIWVYYSAQFVLMGIEFPNVLCPPLRLAKTCSVRRPPVVTTETCRY